MYEGILRIPHGKRIGMRDFILITEEILKNLRPQTYVGLLLCIIYEKGSAGIMTVSNERCGSVN
jgi:hypothetical protein